MEFRGQILEQLLAYWLSLSVDGQIPHRKQFNPMAVPQVLPWMTLIYGDKIGPQYRLTGTHIDQMLPPTHMNSPITLAADHVRPSATVGYQYLLSVPCVYMAHGLLKIKNRDVQEVDHLILPLCMEEGHIIISAGEVLCDLESYDQFEEQGYVGTQRVWIMGLPEPGYTESLPEWLLREYRPIGTEIHVSGDYLGRHAAISSEKDDNIASQ